MSRSDRVVVTLPDPGRAGTLDELVDGLRRLKTVAGSPSYDTITRRVNAAWKANRPGAELVGKTTVVDCFRSGRRRLNVDLVVSAIIASLDPARSSGESDSALTNKVRSITWPSALCCRRRRAPFFWRTSVR